MSEIPVGEVGCKICDKSISQIYYEAIMDYTDECGCCLYKVFVDHIRDHLKKE